MPKIGIIETIKGCKPLIAAARRSEDRHIRLKREGLYKSSASYIEANIYRAIVKRSWLPKPQKQMLLSFCNLWFRHGKPDSLIMSIKRLTLRMKWARDTARKHLRALIHKGLVNVTWQGGNGRGDVTEYAVDLKAIQETFDPEATIIIGSDEVSCDGEIIEPEKGLNSPAPYIYNNTLLPRTRVSLRFRAFTHLPERLLLGLMERLASNARRKHNKPAASPTFQLARTMG